MKKVSTAARCEFGKFAGQKLTIGLDLGDRSSWYCVLDEQGELLLEQKVATTVGGELRDLLALQGRPARRVRKDLPEHNLQRLTIAVL
jgi:hypothetical protein